MVLFYRALMSLNLGYFISDCGKRGGNPKAIPRPYIPPEHIFGSKAEDMSLNQKTDIWALGAAACC